jgi:hypothetical protein
MTRSSGGTPEHWRSRPYSYRVDRETELRTELATAAIRWYANQNDAELAACIESSCNRFGRPDLLLYSIRAQKATGCSNSELYAALAWEMNDTGRRMHDVIVSLLDRAGITYSEGPPGNLRLRFDSVSVYDTFRESLEDEILADAWPSNFSLFHSGPYS